MAGQGDAAAALEERDAVLARAAELEAQLQTSQQVPTPACPTRTRSHRPAG